jgi:hypothetical protein
MGYHKMLPCIRHRSSFQLDLLQMLVTFAQLRCIIRLFGMVYLTVFDAKASKSENVGAARARGHVIFVFLSKIAPSCPTLTL